MSSASICHRPRRYRKSGAGNDAYRTQSRNATGGGRLGWIGAPFFVCLLLVGVGVIGDGLKWISGGAEATEQNVAKGSNPVVGGIPGILAT
jgi:hypothetical protein